MPRKIPKITNDEDKLAQYKEGDVIFTTNYGKCTIDFIEDFQTNSVIARDENGRLHYVNVKQIITED